MWTLATTQLHLDQLSLSSSSIGAGYGDQNAGNEYPYYSTKQKYLNHQYPIFDENNSRANNHLGPQTSYSTSSLPYHSSKKANGADANYNYNHNNSHAYASRDTSMGSSSFASNDLSTSSSASSGSAEAPTVAALAKSFSSM